MGWGILESARTPFPKGTSRLGVKDTVNDETPELDTAKRSGTTVLSPQPSDDPNDPLNWSLAWKCTHLLVLAFGSAVTNAMTTMLTPGLGPLTDLVHSNDADVSTWILTAPTFWTSAAAFIVVAGTDIWGRRPFYVWSAVLLALCNFAGFFSQSFPMLAVARTVGGLFSAPLFTILTATVSDVFFVHQRGKAIAVWNLLLNAGAQVGQVLAGLVTDSFGVSANFLITALIFTALAPLIFLTVFESAYFSRQEQSSVETLKARPNKLTSEWDTESLKTSPHPPLQPYRARLALSRGRLSPKSFWKGIIKPLGLITSPIVFFSIFLNTLMFLFLAGLSTFLSILLSAPPYSLTPTQIGLTNLPLFVVGIFTGPLFGWLSDAAVGYMARTNGTHKGTAEPEFRLVLLLLSTPITMVGLVAMGSSFENALPLIWILVWMTLINVGAVAGVQIAIVYVIDCHPEHSAQAFASVNMISAGAITLGLSPMIGWLEADGPGVVFGFMAGAAAVVTVAALPVYVFGKRMRAWYQQAAWAQKLLD
ncbi:MFS general substrate transporter [Polyplosphaeria fusca]|uniref:MFS general substrate transporter n=1 Tax=Polyplosphaeria fusca TaxID=682080 RepID=A0A9P4QKF5_9PLEO|nr:MFS general substrate transporter [Polyplosphaeria fusca]